MENNGSSKPTIEFKVSRTANVTNVAETLAKMVLRGNNVRLIGVGAGAINQMAKAAAAALKDTAPHGIMLRWRVYFKDVPIPEDVPRVEGDRDNWTAVVMETDS